MAMRSWYDILTPQLVKREDETGIRISEQAIQALIARENARGIPSSRIVLAGFSQGCAMTLHTGIRFKEKLAGLMGLSGYLPLIDMAAHEREPVNAATPIFLAHGTHDPVVTLERAEASRAKLVDLGYQVQWHTYPMPHSVCAQEIDDISNFLQSVLL
jgi:phospholipase/carboxylesterase